jgi:hypothetical protein
MIVLEVMQPFYNKFFANFRIQNVDEKYFWDQCRTETEYINNFSLGYHVIIMKFSLLFCGD